MLNERTKKYKEKRNHSSHTVVRTCKERRMLLRTYKSNTCTWEKNWKRSEKWEQTSSQQIAALQTSLSVLCKIKMRSYYAYCFVSSLFFLSTYSDYSFLSEASYIISNDCKEFCSLTSSPWFSILLCFQNEDFCK